MVEGYVASKLNAGIFVIDKLPDAAVLVRNGLSTADSGKGRIRLGRIPPFSGRSHDLWSDQSARPPLDLFVGRPNPRSFPLTFWRRAASRHLLRVGPDHTEYGDPRGLARLRSAVGQHLKATRGIAASPDQILITSGIQGALNMTARIFLAGRNPQRVAIENPCYQGGCLSVFRLPGAHTLDRCRRTRPDRLATGSVYRESDIRYTIPPVPYRLQNVAGSTTSLTRLGASHRRLCARR